MAHIEAEKARLVFELDSARRRTLDILKTADANRVVHPASGWRVKDLAAHILIWEEDALAALRARQNGAVYRIDDFGSFESYNDRTIGRYRDMPMGEILAALHTAREAMKAILLALPPEHFAGLMPYPWPWMGSLSNMIEVMVRHERSHADEIRRSGELDK
jgi:hypothetical protein